MSVVKALLHSLLPASLSRRAAGGTRRAAGEAGRGLAAACAVVLCLCLCLPAEILAATKTAAPKEARKHSAPAAAKPASRKSPKATRYEVKSTITLDMTRKKVLYEQNADKAVPPASLTKILSMFVIMDRVKSGRVSLDDRVTVSAKAAATGGSHMGLQPGEKLPLRELLKGMAVASGNDASVAAAQHVAGSEAAFVRLMNAKAKQLGMRNSVFKNVHGLPAKGQYTTARDMLAMTTRYLNAHPETLTLFHTQRFLAHRGYTPNTNPLLGMDGVDGLKTGYVGESGYNLITTARRGKTRLVNVLLGAPSKSVRLHEATKMVESGFATAALQAAKESEAAKAKNAPKKQGKSPGKKSKPLAKVADSSAKKSKPAAKTATVSAKKSTPGAKVAEASSKSTRPPKQTKKTNPQAHYGKDRVPAAAGG